MKEKITNFEKVRAFAIANSGTGRIDTIDDNIFRTWLKYDGQYRDIIVVFVQPNNFCPNGYAVYSLAIDNGYEQMNLLEAAK